MEKKIERVGGMRGRENERRGGMREGEKQSDIFSGAF